MNLMEDCRSSVEAHTQWRVSRTGLTIKETEGAVRGSPLSSENTAQHPSDWIAQDKLEIVK